MRPSLSELNKGDAANIREVYEISQRIEAKIDTNAVSNDRRFSNIEQRLSNIEGRSAIIAVAWSSFVSLIAILLEFVVARMLK